MKRRLLQFINTILIISTVASVYAQKNVGIGTVSPDNSAVLEIQSADR